MMIDAHHHFWDPARGDYGWLTPALPSLYRRFGPEDLSPLMAAEGLKASILIQAAPSEAETDYLLDLAVATSWVLGVVGWVDFDRPDVAQRIAERARAPCFVGVRPMLQDISDSEWILHRARASALRALADQGLVFEALIRPQHLRAIVETARRHPDLTIILDHAAKPIVDGDPDPVWIGDIARAAQQPNIACKVSGLATEAVTGASDSVFEPYFRVLLEAFGVDRLIFGSDWPVLTQAAPYGRWTGIVKAWLEGLGPAATAAIMGQNAQRFYPSRGRS